MTLMMHKMTNKNFLLKIGIVTLISVTGLLLSNVAQAAPSYNDGYNTRYSAGHNKHRSSVSTGYSHSQPRIKHRYTKRLKHYKAPRHGVSQRRYYSPPHYKTYPVTETHTGYYPRSVQPHQSKRYNNTGAVIVGGVLGGVIANDISGGDGAVTAFGALTGAVLAGGLTH